ncbi:DUF1579 domain-containing protein [Roseomonas sp. CECT 9278]|uniref:DUF1579 domain-containing protein n=1 Tax=Roseomonas sp. CECT 9278 TaxID=2845823 RepID=UPI001E57BBAB|nr:DUF1579 domain-containing protein [Roseomonas sp. CECT 9278]CAH0249129.1 hypothetical protein ROS9278_03097 [Roseomonas sp. CECT 9278]
MDLPQPGPEHRWLQRIVGTWRTEGECAAPPGEAPSQMTGTERVRSLGGLWILAEGEGEMPGGGTANSLMTIGFDPAQGAFMGSFVASMMTHLWLYRGVLAGDTLTLDTEGPNFGGEGLARYQDIIALQGDDARTLTSRMQMPDGTWQQVMSARYRRLG